MHGNVSEWTLDQYIPTIYKTRKGLTIDPFEIPKKIYPKTVRGGSWLDSPLRLRSASRRPSSKKWKKYIHDIIQGDKNIMLIKDFKELLYEEKISSYS